MPSKKNENITNQLEDILIINAPLIAAWLVVHNNDDPPAQPWYTSARYFARELISKDKSLLTKKSTLAEKVELALIEHGIKGTRGSNVKDSTILKSFSNINLNVVNVKT